jgi:hypothetical protein
MGRDLRELFGNHKTFESAIASKDLRIATRLRLKQYWETVLAAVRMANIEE